MKLVNEFQEFRKIMCVCPECGEIVRLSDLKIKVKDSGKKTWLDEYEHKCKSMDKKEEKFDEIKQKLRENAREKGRKEAEKVFNKAISPSFKALKYDPHDIKPVLHPIDFIVFKGMNKDSVKDIILLSSKCNNNHINKLREQVKKAVEKKNYEWCVARIGDFGKIELE